MSSLTKNLVLLAATTLVVAACSSSNYPKSMAPPAAVNSPPTIAAVADQTGDQDTVFGPIQLGISDKESDPASLKLEASITGGASVIPADGLALSGTGAARAITLTPFESATGIATITLLVTDKEGASSTRSFKVTVNARNASIREVALITFAKAEIDEPTAINGFTFSQDADDATFTALIPADEP